MTIALIEVREEELQNVAAPFVLYGIYKEGTSPQLKAAFQKLAALRKEMADQYKIIDSMQEMTK